MKIEYLPDGSPDCPLIRIYDFRTAELSALQQAFAALASGMLTRADLTALPGTDGVRGCRLVAVAARAGRGVIAVNDKPGTFEWIGTPPYWDDLVAWVEPFLAPGQRDYQWLYEAGPIQVLLSRTGEW